MTYIELEVLQELYRILDHKGIQLLAIKVLPKQAEYGEIKNQYAICTTWNMGTSFRVGYYYYDEEHAGKHYDLPSARQYCSDMIKAYEAFDEL
jgi:hypothetical protein